MRERSPAELGNARFFYDKRSLLPGPPWCSLHAKCAVVDGARSFISSANFTQRGQERNIEVGVLRNRTAMDVLTA
jgi:phosphatidylserine/phosphatidylglycerophosphate/cardiolipin synthase-like enzyme